MAKLVVLYPQPTNIEKFEKDYSAPLELFHKKTGIPTDVKPYTVTKFLDGPDGKAPYYQMFSMPFESLDALNQTLSSPEMQEVAADAFRISSGGDPVILPGE